MSKIVSLSEAVLIALHSMILIGRSERTPVSVDQISKTTGSSRHHVAKVLQRLSKGGFVGSSRGPKGGFYLLPDTNNISLLKIFEAIEGKIIPTACPMERKICSLQKCLFNNITYDLTNQFIDYLKNQSLANYI